MSLPDHLAQRIFAGEHPVKIWRLHRGLSTNELASRAGIPPATLRRIEDRSRLLVDEAKLLAGALEVDQCELQRFPGQFRGCVEAIEAAGDIEAAETEDDG
jgi:transcriptional regulator with XRE-family HTH domain